MDRSRQLKDCAERLDALAQRCFEFLQDQLSHVQTARGELTAAAARHVATPTELLLEQNAWEEQKSIQQAQIEDQIKHLTGAWKKLESEQRRLMLQGTTRPRSVGQSRAEYSPGADPPEDSSLDLMDSMQMEGVSSAAMQFQRLKREIRHQSRRRR